jgi:hypothetical protein
MLLLITLMNTGVMFGLLTAMAPKAKGKAKGPGPTIKPLKVSPKAKSTSKKEATTQDQVAPDDTTMSAADKKKKQSNLVGSLKNAADKLQGARAGTTTISEHHREQLEVKEKFLDEYNACSRSDPKKTQMLMCFDNDKSCKTWSTYKRILEQKETKTTSAQYGYGAKNFNC